MEYHLQGELRAAKAMIATQAAIIDSQREALIRCGAVATLLLRIAARLDSCAQDVITAITGIGPTGELIA